MERNSFFSEITTNDAFKSESHERNSYPGSAPPPSAQKLVETAAPVPIQTKRIIAMNSAASCLIVQSFSAMMKLSFFIFFFSIFGYDICILRSYLCGWCSQRSGRLRKWHGLKLSQPEENSILQGNFVDLILFRTR